MKKTLIFTAILFLSGCSSVSGKYVSIENGTRFILPETYTEHGIGGLFKNYEYAYIISKGTYIAVGKDSEGTYYRGPSHCLNILSGELAARYIKEGYIPTKQEKLAKSPGPLPGEEGGIYIPFDSKKNKPKYYYYQDYRIITGEKDSKIPLSPSSSEDEYLAINEVAAAQNTGIDDKLALDIATRTTGSTANVTTNAVGASLGAGVGNVIGQAGLRNMQGQILEAKEVENAKIIEIIKSL